MAASFAAKALEPLFCNDRHHYERSDRIGPTHTQQSVQKQATKKAAMNVDAKQTDFCMYLSAIPTS